MEIDHLTVACLATWPMNASEAGDDLALIQTSAFLIYIPTISIKTS